MKLSYLEGKVHPKLFMVLSNMGFDELRPSQVKSIRAGLLDGRNLLVCTPTGSGKTLVAEIAIMNSILNGSGKGIYIVPLKALAYEKYTDFKKKYGLMCNIRMATGDMDSEDRYLESADLIICTAEKLDSLIRHKVSWLRYVKSIVVDEIHLLNDSHRGPTLEILITILKMILKDIQIIGLSATIGNPNELAEWLEAELVFDEWRPVELKEGIYLEGDVEFIDKN